MALWGARSPHGAKRNAGAGVLDYASHHPGYGLRSLNQRSVVEMGSSARSGALERALDRQKIPPGEPLLQRLAQPIGPGQRGDRAGLAAAGWIGHPTPPRAQNAFLEAEQRLRGRPAETDENIGIGELDLAQDE